MIVNIILTVWGAILTFSGGFLPSPSPVIVVSAPKTEEVAPNPSQVAPKQAGLASELPASKGIPQVAVVSHDKPLPEANPNTLYMEVHGATGTPAVIQLKIMKSYQDTDPIGKSAEGWDVYEGTSLYAVNPDTGCHYAVRKRGDQYVHMPGGPSWCPPPEAPQN